MSSKKERVLISSAPLSDSSASNKSRALELYGEMRTSTPELSAAYPCAFERLPEETVCGRDFYHQYATFLTEYISSSARSEAGYLAPKTALVYFGALMQIAGTLYAQKGSQESKDFLTCLLPKAQTPSAHWYKRVRVNIHTTVTTRAAKNGEELDHSASPVTVEHLSLVSRAYALNGSEEAAERKMAISTLRSAAGRASEAGLVNWDGMEYDLGFDCPFQEFLQLKTGKVKRVPFLPGKTRHLCWYLDTADYLIGQRNRESYSPDEPAFLFPFLAKSSGSGTKISNFLKDLRQRPNV